MAGIYKAYDIRGIYPTELDEEIMLKLGRAYGDMLTEAHPEGSTIVVGRDMRTSGEVLKNKLIEGLTMQGVHVVYGGLMSTPTFFFAVAACGFQGGMQVSASHNPKEYNGVKIVKAGAESLGYDTGINEIERRVQTNVFKVVQKKGKVTEKKTFLHDHVQFELKEARVSHLQPFKIVADPANGMGAHYLTELFKHIPGELIKINFELDGNFPNHPANPLHPGALDQLRVAMKDHKADLGVATDGDADRIFFLDEHGELITNDITHAIMARLVLEEHPGALINVDPLPGRIRNDVILENGGKIMQTKVGSTLIKQMATEQNALFVGELSGHFCFKTSVGVFETPMIVLLKMLQLMSRERKPLSQIVKPYRKYFQSGEINFEVHDKEGAMNAVEHHFKDGEISHLDGVSITYPDFWFIVRPSNTEPLLRFRMEGRSRHIVDEKTKEASGVLEKFK